ncbi:MAG TPA: hypothetical protein VFC57_09435, partial [Aeromicrobium sp.]|nr:hypothetical protein [Aeromicrobium sp.]
PDPNSPGRTTALERHFHAPSTGSEPTGNTIFVVDECYETPAGIARHWQDTTEDWPEMSSAAQIPNNQAKTDGKDAEPTRGLEPRTPSLRGSARCPVAPAAMRLFA